MVDQKNLLSYNSLAVYKLLYDKYHGKDQSFKDFIDEIQSYGFKITENGTFLQKDMCIVSLLNEYQQLTPLTQKEYDIIADFAVFLENIFNVCQVEQLIDEELATTV